MSRLDHLQRFYGLLYELEQRLGGSRRLSDCSGWLPWPKRGVYFFMEPGELRTGTGDGPRVTRVGAHAVRIGSGTKLWDRLYNHKGTARTGGGYHRGFVFRRLVGTALIARDCLDYPTWDDGSDKAPPEITRREQPLEIAVSQVIGNMPFLWVSIEDDPGPRSLRAFVERNSIALLSNSLIDPPSSSWLGQHCNRDKVRSSGLWNSDHTEKSYDPAFLDTLASLVDQMNEPA